MTIGGNLKKLRVAQGLTQDQLAEKLHVTRQAVSNWERNVSHPDLDQLEAIAAALGVEVTTLLYGPPQPYRPSRKRVGVTVGLAAAAVTAFAVCHGGLEPWLVQGYQRGYPGHGLLYELLFFGPVLGLLLGIAAGGVLGLRFPLTLERRVRQRCAWPAGWCAFCSPWPCGWEPGCPGGCCSYGPMGEVQWASWPGWPLGFCCFWQIGRAHV